MCLFSRPTAVNLSDAATKLKQIAAKIAATASEYKSVFEVGVVGLTEAFTVLVIEFECGLDVDLVISVFVCLFVCLSFRRILKLLK